MQECLIEIIENLNNCAYRGLNYFSMDSESSKILLEYINSLQEIKEDLQFHIEELQGQIEEIENDYDSRIEELQGQIYDLGGTI